MSQNTLRGGRGRGGHWVGRGGSRNGVQQFQQPQQYSQNQGHQQQSSDSVHQNQQGQLHGARHQDGGDQSRDEGDASRPVRSSHYYYAKASTKDDRDHGSIDRQSDNRDKESRRTSDDHRRGRSPHPRSPSSRTPSGRYADDSRPPPRHHSASRSHRSPHRHRSHSRSHRSRSSHSRRSNTTHSSSRSRSRSRDHSRNRPRNRPRSHSRSRTQEALGRGALPHTSQPRSRSRSHAPSAPDGPLRPRDYSTHAMDTPASAASAAVATTPALGVSVPTESALATLVPTASVSATSWTIRLMDSVPKALHTKYKDPVTKSATFGVLRLPVDNSSICVKLLRCKKEKEWSSLVAEVNSSCVTQSPYLMHYQEVRVLHAPLSNKHSSSSSSSSSSIEAHLEMRRLHIDLLSHVRKEPNLQSMSAASSSSPSNVLRWMAQLICAVASMHNKQIAHLDLKSANVMIDVNTTNVCLLDFGLARHCPSSVSLPFTCDFTLCSLHYRAPEIWAQQSYGLPADIFSLGCVLLELCCGQRVHLFQELVTTAADQQQGLNTKARFEDDQPKFKKASNALFGDGVHNHLTLDKQDAGMRQHLIQLLQQKGSVKVPNLSVVIELLVRMLRRDPSQRPSIWQVMFDASFQSVLSSVVIPTPQASMITSSSSSSSQPDEDHRIIRCMPDFLRASYLDLLNHLLVCASQSHVTIGCTLLAISIFKHLFAHHLHALVPQPQPSHTPSSHTPSSTERQRCQEMVLSCIRLAACVQGRPLVMTRGVTKIHRHQVDQSPQLNNASSDMSANSVNFQSDKPDKVPLNDIDFRVWILMDGVLSSGYAWVGLLHPRRAAWALLDAFLPAVGFSRCFNPIEQAFDEVEVHVKRFVNATTPMADRGSVENVSFNELRTCFPQTSSELFDFVQRFTKALCYDRS